MYLSNLFKAKTKKYSLLSKSEKKQQQKLPNIKRENCGINWSINCGHDHQQVLFLTMTYHILTKQKKLTYSIDELNFLESIYEKQSNTSAHRRVQQIWFCSVFCSLHASIICEAGKRILASSFYYWAYVRPEDCKSKIFSLGFDLIILVVEDIMLWEGQSHHVQQQKLLTPRGFCYVRILARRRWD